MAKAVLVEQVSEDEYTVWTNADEPSKSVNDHCALVQQAVRPNWREGISGWMDRNGYRYHKDSDFQGPTEEYADGRDFSYPYEP